MRPTLRHILIATLLAVFALPAAAEKISLNALSNYLNALQSSKSTFTQINADGTISTGEFYIKRPGRARFNYNPPEKAFVVVGGGAVAIFDGKTGSPPEQYPIGNTPLKYILQKNLDLAKSGIVKGHSFDGTATIVSAQDPDHPQNGTIEMVFTNNPVELRQWVIRQQGGEEVTVILGDLDKSTRVPDILFNITNEISKLQN
ncbi:MAG: outer membrane lipoprotein carrier protein LolA [Marinovum sp.]|nr:outer membrane lipoprotein carrier protein LolA [Marinovum sp.]